MVEAEEEDGDEDTVPFQEAREASGRAEVVDERSDEDEA